MKDIVLIVDDIPENIDVLGEMLCSDYTVSAAVNGIQALDVAANSNPRPDLILLDVMMPEMDGFEVCRRLKMDERTCETPVIFITIGNNESDEVKGFSLGAVDFIRKPVSEAIVKSRVRSHLALRRYNDHLQKYASRQRLFFRQLFMESPFGILLTDMKGQVMEVNKQFERIFGFEGMDYFVNKGDDWFIPEGLRQEHENALMKNVNGEPVRMETRRKTTSGDLIDVSITSYPVALDSLPECIFYFFEDISLKKQLENELRRQALHDPLTNIPNRILMAKRLNRAMKRLKRNNQSAFAILLIDLDRFKQVNDSLGHLAGDHVLINISIRIQSCLSPKDTLLYSSSVYIDPDILRQT